jgi:hypothetical protein
MRVVLVVLGLVAAARVAAGFIPSTWLWGLETFRYWPPAGHALLVALAAIGFVPPIARTMDRGLDRLGWAWEKAGFRGDLGVATAVALLIFALRDPVRFTGDSMMRAGLINISVAGAARLMGYYFPLDEALNLGVPRLLVGFGLSSATAIQLVGALVGGAWAWVSIAFVRAMGARGAALPAGALVMLGAGTLIHFAGYDKFGPLMLGIAIASLGAVRLARSGHGLVALTVGAAVAVLSHRSGYFILPAVVWVLFRTYAGARGTPGRVAVGVAAVLIVVASAVMIPRTIEVATKVDLAVHLPGGAGTHSREATGTNAMAAKLIHVPNVITFLVPLWLAGLAAAWAARAGRGGAARGSRPSGGFSLLPVFGLGFGALGALVFAIAPGGGWPRDWDSSLGAATVAALGTTGALVIAWSRAGGVPRTTTPAAMLALAVSISLWGVHASEAISLRRIERLLGDRALWSEFTRANAYDILGANQLNAGHFERAARYFQRAIENAPNPRYFHQLGLVRLGLGQLDEARADFRHSIDRNPGVSDPWVGLARVALAKGDTVEAAAAADSALARSAQNREALELRRVLGLRVR